MNDIIKKIQFNTKKFEYNLTNIIKKYIKKKLEKEQKHYTTIENNIINYIQKNKKLQKLKILITQLKTTFFQLDNSTTIDTLTHKIRIYFYLKNKIK